MLRSWTVAAYLLAGTGLTNSAKATDYHFCISSDRRPGNLVVKSGPVDFGKEWYRVKSAQSFCSLIGASGCSSTDYNQMVCGAQPEETVTYAEINGDQLAALFSGNPLLTVQTAVEVVIGVPVKAALSAGTAVVGAAHAACRWFNPHC